MSDLEFNAPAYPGWGAPGLTIRQQAVLMMAAGFAANPAAQPTEQHHFDNLAAYAVRYADAVLAAERETR